MNVRVNDAWGLRDVLGSSLLLGARYTASMSKPREAAFRLLPPGDAAVCGVPRPTRPSETKLGRYELRPATAVRTCMPAVPQPERLLAMMRQHRFGIEYPADQHRSDLERELSDPENIFRWLSAVNARFDSGQLGASLQGPGLDLRELWIVPRVHLIRGWGIETLLTRSASRWADTYAVVGYEQGIVRTDAQADEEEGASVSGFVSEAGVKFRLTASGRARWALLGYRFGGVRLGIRANGFTRLRHPRLVVEVGAGAF